MPWEDYPVQLIFFFSQVTNSCWILIPTAEAAPKQPQSKYFVEARSPSWLRQRFAKPSFAGSNPARASIIFPGKLVLRSSSFPGAAWLLSLYYTENPQLLLGPREQTTQMLNQLGPTLI
jgi:hypothetical protein